MNRETKLKLLHEWQETIQNADRIMDKLGEVVGGADGPLGDSMYRMQAVYTRAMSLLLNDENNWLEWYALENEMGKGDLTATPGNGVPLKTVKTLDQVLMLIEAGA